MSNLDMATTHLNASVGAVLSPLQLAAALRAASLDVLSDAPEAAAVASYLFVEIEPSLVAGATDHSRWGLSESRSLERSAHAGMGWPTGQRIEGGETRILTQMTGSLNRWRDTTDAQAATDSVGRADRRPDQSKDRMNLQKPT